MCDEYEQKTQRLQVLQQKIEEIKKIHGEYALSGERGKGGGRRRCELASEERGKGREGRVRRVLVVRNRFILSPSVCNPKGSKVQNFKDSLELKDSEIYCQRARKIYSSPELIRTSLFQFSMSGMKLKSMFDPSMLGKEKLIDSLKEMDSIRY